VQDVIGERTNRCDPQVERALGLPAHPRGDVWLVLGCLIHQTPTGVRVTTGSTWVAISTTISFALP
jgi:hypothetical protein